MKGWEKILHAMENHKTASVAVFISHKIDFKSKPVRRKRRAL